jgi:acyl dehydratase
MSLFAADLDELESGATHESPLRTVADDDVAAFAALTGDHHPAHVDPDWAAAGPFGRPIAHGLLILSCAAGSLPLDPDRVLALRRLRDVVFKRPLAVGDAIAVRCTITSTRAIDESTGLVECAWRIIDADGRLVARAVVEILWARGGPRGTDDAANALASVQVADDGIHVLL